jgi:hypothetical protein
LYNRSGEWSSPRPPNLAVDVPDDIVRKEASDWLPLSQGLVQFDIGAGLEDLLLAWSTLAKEIRSVP